MITHKLRPPELNLQLPYVFHRINEPARIKCYLGGRGSSKSWTIAKWILLECVKGPERVLCAREYQNSIADSVHRLLCDQIDAMGLGAFFEITKTEIRGKNGSEIIFRGLHHNATEIKSIEGITLCWVEEAEKVSENSWDILIPTIRAKRPNGTDSEIVITFNPARESDPTYQRFVINARPDWIVQRVNYSDNPYFPDVLRAEMEWDKKTNYDKYRWIWEGYPLGLSDAQVFKGKYVVEDFEAMPNERFFFGADWGFAQDPSTLVRCFVRERTLYIDYEVYGIGVEIDKLPAFFAAIPGSKAWKCYADSARPETISYMQRNGYPKMLGVKKWPGSVEDGVEYIKGFERVVVHPRCRHTLDEFETYAYKVDRLTGDVLPIIVDKQNHIIDALRYSLSDYIKTRGLSTPKVDIRGIMGV